MNVLGIGAHYDDLELGCSGTLAKHVEAGDNVTMIVVSDSAFSNPQGKVIREPEVARSEGESAAKIIGADLVCLDYKTLEVPFDEGLSSQLLSYIERLKVDIIYSHWVHDVHRDHQFAGRCSMMAGRHVPRFLMYRSNFYDTGVPFHGNFYSDISSQFERKVKVVKAHKSELERVRYKWLDFFRNQNANDGQKIGVEYAECFEIVRYLA